MGNKTPEERIRELAKEVSDVAQPYLEKAQPVVEDMKSKAQPVIEDVKSKAQPYIEIVKEKAQPAAKRATEVARNAKENLTKQAAKLSCNEEVFVQYSDHEVRTSDIIEKAKFDYISKGNKISDIHEIQVYIKPADKAAYYIVNHSETGKVEI